MIITLFPKLPNVSNRTSNPTQLTYCMYSLINCTLKPRASTARVISNIWASLLYIV